MCLGFEAGNCEVNWCEYFESLIQIAKTGSVKGHFTHSDQQQLCWFQSLTDIITAPVCKVKLKTVVRFLFTASSV